MMSRMADMDIPRIQRAAVELMMRDHVEDVRRLNSKLGHGNSAELSEDVPPNPFVGDPGSLERGNCIAIMGINPALDRKMKPRFVKNEILIPMSCKEDFLASRDIISFNRWIRKIRNYYFSDAYNGGYFTTIGKKLGATWFIDRATSDPDLEMAKKILHNNTIKFDSIPYYSIEAKALSSNKVAEQMDIDPALKCHVRCIEALVEEIQPQRLLVNGINVAGEVARNCFIDEETLEEMRVRVKSRNARFEVGWSIIGRHKMPTLVVPFMKYMSMDTWKSISSEFENWLENQD
jgi:hypothetical protein